MAQEYFINSRTLEDKIRQVLPSQGGAGAGFDLSASTQIIPIIDLTETSDGSVLREDLQTAMSHDSMTVFNIINTTTTIVSNTGYWRVFGSASMRATSASITGCSFSINDGSTDKKIIEFNAVDALGNEGHTCNSFDFIVFLSAGDSLKGKSNNDTGDLIGNVRQIADIAGTLVNP